MKCFVLMGDEKFSHTISVSVEQIRKIYPDSKILFYNWGVGSQLEKELLLQNVEIIDWTANSSKIRNRHKSLSAEKITKMKLEQFSKKNWVNHLLYNLFRAFLWVFLWERIWVRKYKKWALIELLLLEKTACMKHASSIIGDNHMIFLDADAILISPIDELFDLESDLMLTIRRNGEIESDINKYQVVNTGVIVFSKNAKKRDLIIGKWKDLANSIIFEIYLAEQTAMGLLIERNSANPMDWKYGSQSVILDNTEIQLDVLPCEVYNFNWIEEIIANQGKIEGQKVLHFKGSRHSHETFKNLFANLELN